MPVLLLALALAIPAFTSAGETGGWERHPAPIDQPLHRVFFLDDRAGWILTYGGGTVLHTRDGGASWRVQARVASDFLEAIRFVDAENGWLIGDYGAVFSSADGGATWREVSPPVEGRIRKVEGGPAWHLDAEYGGFFVTYSKARFSGPRRAWVAGLKIADARPRSHGPIAFATEDGGATWTRLEEPPAVSLADAWRRPPDDFGESFYLDARHGWRLEGRGKEKKLERTVDGGESWQKVALPELEVWFWRGLAFTDAGHGILLGEVDRELDTGVLYETADGGLSWLRDALELPAPHAIALTPSKIWIVGKEGLLLSRDRGTSAEGR